MIMVFLGGEGLMCVESLDLRETFTQDHFINFGPSDLKTHAQTFYRRKHPIKLALHNSRCHKGQKVADEMRRNDTIRLDRLPYSPDLSPCGLWSFGV
jgi:hypothetical protein